MANDRNDYSPYGYDRDHEDGARGSGSGRAYGYSRDRDEYRPAGDRGTSGDRNFRAGGTGYGDRGYRPDAGGDREVRGYGNRDYYGGSREFGNNDAYRQAFGSDRHRGDPGRHHDDRPRDRGYGRAPQGYDYQDRGFVARAGDEVRSWFGDEEAERRREFDQRYDERQDQGRNAATAYGRDSDYHSWRRGQMDALDRDYHEYRQENARKFESEFGTWRSNRQIQRASLGQVKEHMDVVGSDGGHVGTVDKVRGDRIILTKNDGDAGGRHHSIPSGWIQTVDDKVTVAKTADEAHRHWRDEEASGALFGDDSRTGGRNADGRVDLNRSFSGTY